MANLARQTTQALTERLFRRLINGEPVLDEVEYIDAVEEVVLLDAHVEHRRRDIDDSKWRRLESRHTRPAPDGNPDLMRKLSADPMKAEG